MDQHAIDVERDAMNILRLIVRWSDVSDIVWTRDAIKEWTGIDDRPASRWALARGVLAQTYDSRRRLSEALEWLTKREYLQVSRSGQYTRTTDGERAYELAAANGRFRVDARLFRDEALTGVTASGARSQLTRAVLPSTSVMQAGVTCDDVWLLMRAARVRNNLAVTLGLTVDEVMHGMEDGTIRRCPACGSTARFHKNQTACIECRRDRRR